MGDLFSGQICMSTWGTRGRAQARTIFLSFFFWPPRPRMRPARRTDAAQPRLGVCTKIFLDREITVQRGQGGVTFHRIDANKVAGRPGGEQARTNAILPSIGLSKQMLSLARRPAKGRHDKRLCCLSPCLQRHPKLATPPTMRCPNYYASEAWLQSTNRSEHALGHPS